MKEMNEQGSGSNKDPLERELLLMFKFMFRLFIVTIVATFLLLAYAEAAPDNCRPVAEGKEFLEANGFKVYREAEEWNKKHQVFTTTSVWVNENHPAFPWGIFIETPLLKVDSNTMTEQRFLCILHEGTMFPLHKSSIDRAFSEAEGNRI